MKKIILVSIIFFLILATALIKRSTKNIEDQIFVLNENIRFLNSQLGRVLLEHNYLSSSGKLLEYQSQFFKKELVNKDITKFKILKKKMKYLLLKVL